VHNITTKRSNALFPTSSGCDPSGEQKGYCSCQIVRNRAPLSPATTSAIETRLSLTETSHVEGRVADSRIEAPVSRTETSDHVADPPSCSICTVETTVPTPCTKRAHISSEAGIGSSRNPDTDAVVPLGSEKSLTDIEMALKATKDAVVDPSSGNVPVPTAWGEKIHCPVLTHAGGGNFNRVLISGAEIHQSGASCNVSTLSPPSDIIGSQDYPSLPCNSLYCLVLMR
jgi:hypothetical protein